MRSVRPEGYPKLQPIAEEGEEEEEEMMEEEEGSTVRGNEGTKVSGEEGSGSEEEDYSGAVEAEDKDGVVETTHHQGEHTAMDPPEEEGGSERLKLRRQPKGASKEEIDICHFGVGASTV